MALIFGQQLGTMSTSKLQEMSLQLQVLVEIGLDKVFFGILGRFLSDTPWKNQYLLKIMSVLGNTWLGLDVASFRDACL